MAGDGKPGGGGALLPGSAGRLKPVRNVDASAKVRDYLSVSRPPAAIVARAGYGKREFTVRPEHPCDPPECSDPIREEMQEKAGQRDIERIVLKIQIESVQLPRLNVGSAS